MVFSSEEFILGFLPLTLIGFFACAALGSRALAVAWLVVASFFFYGWWNPRYLLLLALSIGVNFALAKLLESRRSVMLLGLGIAFNLGLLGYFKYANFVLGTASALFGVTSITLDIALPLAISFFTFQQIAYLVDVYEGKTFEDRFLHYCLFICFFPQFIAGPIVHHSEVIPQFQRRGFPRLNGADLAVGLVIFVIGFDKKVFIADAVASLANPVFDQALASPPSFVEAWYGSLAYSFQLYFDFSGYSDMAIGLARMFGIKLPLNFHSPYKATNIIDFWRRWHITLSRFLRRHLYFPLGGNRHGEGRRIINIVIVMLLGGLWHGAGWTFAAWGGLHGVFLVVNHAWRAARVRLGHDLDRSTPWGRWLGRLVTFLAVVVAWVLFRAADWATALAILQGMAGLNGVVLPPALFADFPLLGGWLAAAGAKPGALVALEEPVAAWLPVLLAIVWLAPNTQQLMARYAPALGYDAEAVSPAWRRLLEAMARRLHAARAYVAVLLVSGSATIAVFVGLSRGAISNEFIYMIF